MFLLNRSSPSPLPGAGVVQRYEIHRLRRIEGWVIFGFGLHGLGFAGVLSELGLPERSFILSLLGFNLSVEVGQVAIILGIALLLRPLKNRQWYRKMVTIPFNGVYFALVGLYWTFERVYSAMI